MRRLAAQHALLAWLTAAPRALLPPAPQRKAELSSQVLECAQQLAARQRLALVAADALREFVFDALLAVRAEARPSDLGCEWAASCRPGRACSAAAAQLAALAGADPSHPMRPLPAALPACLACLGSLPLVALAQLAAFLLQLVGRSFLDLSDLCPETFQAVSEDAEAEVVPGGQVQLSSSGLADLLGLPAAALGDPPADGADSGNTACAAAALAPLLQHGARHLAQYATTGTLAGGRPVPIDRPSVQRRRQLRHQEPGWQQLLMVLQQRVFLVSPAPHSFPHIPFPVAGLPFTSCSTPAPPLCRRAWCWTSGTGCSLRTTGCAQLLPRWRASWTGWTSWCARTRLRGPACFHLLAQTSTSLRKAAGMHCRAGGGGRGPGSGGF